MALVISFNQDVSLSWGMTDSNPLKRKCIVIKTTNASARSDGKVPYLRNFAYGG